jgi:EAL domain-containing protein (putative c-di-GMP-specific phosphodiesterase class I)
MKETVLPLSTLGAYGADARALLARQQARLGPLIDRIVERFYDGLMVRATTAPLLALLTDAELAHLRQAQADYLRRILAPDLNCAEHHRMAVGIGQRHANVGLSQAVLSDASLLYSRVLAELIGRDTPELEALHVVLNQRLQHDLIAQLDGYTQWEHARLALLEDLVLLGYEATHVLDYTQQALKALHERADLAGVALGGIRNGNYRHLLTVGTVLYDRNDPACQRDEEGEADEPGYPTIEAPHLQRTWFEERPLIVPSVARSGDDQFDAVTRQHCLDLGLRSVGLWPTRSLQGAPDACLFLFSRWPGHFGQPGQRRFWQRLADQIGMTMDNLVRHGGGGRRRHRLSDGLRFRHWLAQGRVTMFYQPIVDPRRRKVLRVEALARLQDPAGRVLTPDRFLAAYGTLQLTDLFELSLTRVIEDMKARPSLAGLSFSVNLPTEVMRQTEWLRSLPERVQRLGGEPSRIGLEILESALSDDPALLEVLALLRQAGFSILLDDVGAGESSLLRLATLPITGIKIDQGFVRPLQQDFDKLDFILTLLLLAQQRGLDCVAEGAESPEIVDMLGSLDRVLLQGYGIARPMPPGDLADWVGTWEAEAGPAFPSTLYGWYSRHVSRQFVVRQALCTVPDLIDVTTLVDGEQCALHALLIERFAADSDLIEAHRCWHQDYARFTDLSCRIRDGQGDPDSLNQAMHWSRQQLKGLVQSKLAGTAAAATAALSPPASIAPAPR